jgi:hypothetical protein
MADAQIWDLNYVFRREVLGIHGIRSGDDLTETMVDRGMAREINIGARRFWVVSEPSDRGWKAQVLEVLDEVGATHRTGIETIGETRSMADDKAIGKLQHRLRDRSF